jgi:hypothetical protein
MIIYLHGFRSGPQSWKSRSLKARMDQLGLGDAFWGGQLPVSAHEAMALAEAQIARSSTPPTLVGSSLGGYYATCLAERHGLKAVLVNPAVLAPLSLSAYIGTQTHMYTGEPFDFTLDHVEQLRAIEPPAITRPERYWLMVETGDEVLDYRHAVARYAGARQTVLEGGDHSFTQWDNYLDLILAYAGLLPTP